MVASYVDLRTIKGDVLSVTLPSNDPTVGEVVDMLKQPPYNYAPGVALMFSGRVLDLMRRVNEFPPGHVIIAGHPAVNNNAAKKQPSPKAGSPQTKTTAPPAATTTAGGARPTAAAGNKNLSPHSPSSPPSAAMRTVSPQPALRGTTQMTLTIQIPAASQVLTATVADNCTVGDLIARTPTLAGARLVFQGKLISNSPNNELKSFGIHDGGMIHAALASHDPKFVVLMEIRADFEKVRAPIAEAKTLHDVPENHRRQFYEDSMKLLYRLDMLEELSPELRAQRKQLVQDIQKLQDAVQASVSHR